MPPVVRRQPLLERIQAFLNPLDFLLWLSEELDINGWERLEKEWAIPIGVGLNVVFLIARANANLGARRSDDVFGEPTTGNGWLVWLVSWALAKSRSVRTDSSPHSRPPSSYTSSRSSRFSTRSTPFGAKSTIGSSKLLLMQSQVLLRRIVYEWTPHLSHHLHCNFYQIY
jgi:hypothetical protein